MVNKLGKQTFNGISCKLTKRNSGLPWTEAVKHIKPN